MLGLIFRKAQNRIQDPAKLRQLIVELIGKESWLSMSADVKGDAYEGLLERNAQDTKSGAGQYFTPRPSLRLRLSKRTLSGTTTAARPWILRRLRTCWTKLSCLFEVVVQKSGRLCVLGAAARRGCAGPGHDR